MIKKLAVFLAFFHVAAFALHAKALPTNFIQNITLTFMSVGPGNSTATSDSVSNVVLTTRTAIQAFGAATANSFSSKAQILAVASVYWYTNTVVTTNRGRAVTNNYVYGYANNPSFVIKDGTNVVDITGYLTIDTVNTDTIASSSHHQQGSFAVYTAYKQYRLRSISVSQTPVTFSAQGFVVTPTLVITVAPGVIFYAFDDNWTSLSGHGNLGGNDFLFQGTVNATFLRLE